jgi:hypothetical protein
MSRKKWLIAALAGMAIALAAGIAYAAWSVSGSGSGGAGAKSALGLVVTEVDPSSPGASLYPGGPAGWVYFTIQNPNPFPVTVTGVSFGTPVSQNTTACPSANVSIDAGAPTTLNIPINANQTTGTLQVFGVLDMAHSAPDGCQGVDFSVPITVSGKQQ